MSTNHCFILLKAETAAYCLVCLIYYKEERVLKGSTIDAPVRNEKEKNMIATIEALNAQDLMQARTKAQALLELVQSDRALATNAAANPGETLSALGFADGARPSFGMDTNGMIEHGSLCCSDGTCFISACPSTCNVTF